MINRIQNKYVYITYESTVYICYVYINTHMHAYI